MDRTNRNTALASAMAEELARSGVRHAVISPGSRSAPLALALWRRPEIDTRVVLDERSAGFVALGAAAAGGRPSIVLCTSGSAAANLHPAVAEADEAGVPLLVLTADRPPELRGIGAGQTIDQLKLYGSAVRWFCEVGTHEADDSGLLHFRSVACRAYAAARGEPRPGPVHLNVAWRGPLTPLADRDAGVTASSPLALEGRGTRPLTSVEPARSDPDPALLDRLAERIAASPRGVILAGRQTDPALAPTLAGLAAASGYPILAEPTSQVRLGGHDRSRVVWPYDAISASRPPSLAPELVLRFGDMPTSKALRQWIAALEPGQAVVAPHGWHEPTRRADELVRADAAQAAAGLAARLGGAGGDASAAARPQSGWLAGWLRAGELAADAIEAELASTGGPTEPGLQMRLGELYADGDVVYTASSMPIRDQEAFLPAGAAAGSFLANRGANGIDGLVSSGAGAAIASERPTWIVTGELGLIHDAAGLAAAAEAAAPVRIVVVNNDGGGIFEFLPQASAVPRDEFEALFATPSTVEPAKLAAAYGVPHRHVSGLEQLDADEDGAILYELSTDRRENLDLHRRIGDRVAAALEQMDERPAVRGY